MKIVVKEIVKKYKIPESRIINMDETPYFWEYLPRKVLAPKLSNVASGWKCGYQNNRSTLILAIATNGHLLNPTLILQRKIPYTLKCPNTINMKILN